MYKRIDTDNWIRKNTFNWFNSFLNPCYGVTKRIKVKKVYDYSKDTNTSFFINFLYLIMKSFNDVDAFRLRIVNDEVRLYDIVNPAFLVTTKLGTFDNAAFKMNDDYKEFYKLAKVEIDDIKAEESLREGYNSSKLFDEYYISCTPFMDFDGLTQAVPIGNKESLSVPRMVFSKFDNNYDLSFNITASHALIDGSDMAKGFDNLINSINECEKFFK